MKKILALLLIMALSVTVLVSCGGVPKEKTDSLKAKATEVETLYTEVAALIAADDVAGKEKYDKLGVDMKTAVDASKDDKTLKDVKAVDKTIVDLDAIIKGLKDLKGGNASDTTAADTTVADTTVAS